jgi:AP-2 complex subunit alpha
VKSAPPLTPQQISQHNIWYKSTWLANGGPIYDDGALQIAMKSEIRGSQGRFTFHFRNIGTCTMSNFSISIIDSAGLSRHQINAANPTIPPNGQGQQILMMECMKPAFPGPDIKVSYDDSILGSKSNTIKLPINVTSFNESTNINANDFQVRWQEFATPGQAVEQILNPSAPINPTQILQAMTGALKFAHIRGFPDESEFVLYGASSLRTGQQTQTGEKISIGCLVKVEMNVQANAMRITVRTLHPAATHATMQTFQSLLL